MRLELTLPLAPDAREDTLQMVIQQGSGHAVQHATNPSLIQGIVLTFILGLTALLGDGARPSTALAQQELLVANEANNSVTVYTHTWSGNTAPIRTLSAAAARD